METTLTLDIWRQTTLPLVDASEWTPAAAKEGLAEIARLRGVLDAAQAVMVGVMSKSTGRDTSAAVSRVLKLSNHEARKATAVAGVVGRLPGAKDLLASGEVTSEHLARLTLVADTEDAAALLEVASGMSPEDFARTVDKFRISKDANGVKDRQRAARSVRFFNAEEGCFGLRAVLRPLDGERLKAALNAIVDERWRAEHPDRAATSGGHGGDSREQRLADALALVFGGSVPEPSGAGHGDPDDTSSPGARDTPGAPGADPMTDAGAAGEDDQDTGSAERCDTAADRSDIGSADRCDTAVVDADGTEAEVVVEPAAGSMPARAQDGSACSKADVNDVRPPGRSGAESVLSPSGRTMPLPTLMAQTIPPSVATRLGVVVTINAETLEAAILGGRPLPFDDLGDVFRDVRTEFFAMIQATNGAVLQFGRNRRLATPLQRLAVAVRDQGRCAWNGCQVTWDRCDVDHDPPFEAGGRTDVDKLRLLCRCEHHPHRHESGENIKRDSSGQWVVIDSPDSPDARDAVCAGVATRDRGRPPQADMGPQNRDRHGPEG